MRRILIALAIALPISVFSQSPKDAKEVADKSKIEDFIAQSGSLLKKQFIPAGKVKQLEVSTLLLTDVLMKSTIRGVKMEASISKSYGVTTKSCFLDEDEIDGFLNAGKYLLETATSANDEGSLEFHFTSRSGVQSGVFKDRKDNWNYFVRVEKYDGDSIVFLKKDEFTALLDLVRAAKAKF